MDIKILGILSGLFLFFLGFIVWYQNRKNPANISLSVFAASSALWCFCLYFYENPVLYTPRVWITLAYFFVFLMVGSTLYFSSVFPNGSTKEATIPVVLYTIFSLPFIYFLFFTNYWIKDVVIVNAARSTITGPVYLYWGIFNLLSGIFIINNFIKRYKASSLLSRLQLRYVFVGIGIMAVSTLAVDVIVPVIFGNSSYFWVSSLFIIPFIGLSTYAIIKHRLFDIRLIIARSVSYSLLLVILGVIYSSGLFVISSLITKTPTPASSLISSTVLALVIAFTFQPLRGLLEKTTDKVFFKEGYDTESVLNTLSKTMATSLTLNDLTTRVLSIITSELRLADAAFVTMDGKNIQIVESRIRNKKLEMTAGDIEKMKVTKKLLVLDEMEESGLKKLMRDKEIFISMPLSTKEHFIGFLLLGEKSSGEIFFDQDINFLSILGPELSVALENAQRFEEISKFNITLQEEVKRATRELESANLKLKKLDQVKDEFISIASHDLRSPMATVKNYIWLARSELGKTPAKAKEDLDIALESTEHGISLVADMLDVSRIEAGRIELTPEKLDIGHEITLVVEELQKQAGDKKINLGSETSEEINVKADKERLHQVITNLAGNAIKFTPDGGRVTITAVKAGNMVEITVSDTGIGIKKEDIDKLFTKFGKLENSTNLPTTAGTGLGLYICKNIIELSGGKIRVESTLGKGSKFIFTLPSL
ncbi:MAG: ATP-binding protein [Candidatus Microgenomates bacterium]|jgi:signal transduction histidine kinase